MNDNVLIIDFGSQFTQLIARRVREMNVYCEIHPYNNLPDNIENFKAVILSGSPFSAMGNDAPSIDLNLFRKRVSS
jgi:GMP synthase (glutamine-hydrolysing)